jgi:hypothetical protein
MSQQSRLTDSNHAPTIEPPAITDDWRLDQELLAIARTIVQVLETSNPRYEDYRSRRDADDA